MSLIVDASVALKWFVEEAQSTQARALAAADEPLIAPDLVVAEVGNALWKKCRIGAITRAQAVNALDQLPKHFDELHLCPPLRLRAVALALDLNHPIYDCLYIALALRESASLVTANARLRDAATKARVRVRMIGA
jgi:predicted nucleic acid-binding protein